MKVLVGDEFGLIKCVDTEKKLIVSKFGNLSRNNSVIGINNLFEDSNDILSVCHEKDLYILDWSGSNIKVRPNIQINEKTLFTSHVVKRTIDFSSIIVSRNDNKLNLFQYDEELNLKFEKELEIKTKNLHIIKDAPSTQEIFCLFKETPLSIYNLETNEFSWRAKNVPNDEFNLRVPIWDIDVAYSDKNNNTFYTATAYGDLRIYDRKAKPSPVLDHKICKRKINRMALSSCENYITIGDTIGNLFMHDKRKNFSIAHSLKGSTGAVRDILHIKGSTTTVSCGLDRFLRIFDYKSYDDLPQMYLKNKLNVIFPYEINTKINNDKESDSQSENEDEYDDEMFEEGEEEDDIEDLEELEGDEDNDSDISGNIKIEQDEEEDDDSIEDEYEHKKKIKKGKNNSINKII